MSVDYDKLAKQYGKFREPDKRIAARIYKHTLSALSVVNIGAGTGAYEPEHCTVVAVEPSREMIAMRRKTRAVVIQGIAEKLPFKDNSFDVAIGILTIHHWSDIAAGLGEMRRVAKQKIVLLTWIEDSPQFWLEDYFPDMRVVDKALFPTLEELHQWLGGISSEIVEVPGDCTDGFMCAYWKRPEAYLNESVRAAISTFSRMPDIVAGLAQLESDLASGEWVKKYGNLLNKASLDLGYRLVVSNKIA